MSAKEVLPPMFKREIPVGKKYTERLEKEFGLIDKNQFVSVFLQVQTIMGFMKDIPHVIRGSAGSSLVCWLLGISDSDPLLYGMELARFMNDFRTDIPDIDIDVPYNRRDELYARIAAAFPERVARISNHVMFQPKSALREAVRRSGVKGRIPKNFKLGQLVGYDAVDSVRAAAKELEGTERLISLHCGGIVIFDKEVPKELILKERIPLEHDPKTTLCQISLDKDETEDSGFIKIDLLSNRGLAQAIEVCKLLGGAGDASDLWSCIPDSWVPRIRQVFCDGDTIGLTFGESRGMRRLFADLRPQTIEEIGIALALIRPAAAEGGRKRSFVKKYTEGTLPSDQRDMPIVYDDDAIKRICAVLSCSPAEGDKWRKAFAKGRAENFEMQCALRGLNGLKQKTLINDLNQLTRYSFCKSHALSYAFLVWRLAYFKARWPHEFWTSTLNHCNSDYMKWVHYRGARCSGLLLSRSAGPYKLGLRQGKKALVPVKGGEQMLLCNEDTDKQMLSDMLSLGYWCSARFFPGCEMKIYKEHPEDRDILAAFSGIVATGRISHGITMICIGVGNDRFIDLVVQGTSPELLSGAVEGMGVYITGACETVHVETIRKCSYERLLWKETNGQ
jgi:DNA polymerase III alpha subunit